MTNWARNLTVLLLAFSSTLYAAEVQLLDRIVAVVNDDVIMESELDERVREVLRNLRLDGQRMPPRELLEGQVLERMISENIQLAQAQNSGIRVDDEALNDALAGIARQSGMTLENFMRTVELESGSWADFREHIRTEMMLNQLRQRRVSQRIRISEGELDRFLASDMGKQLFNAELRLGHILIALPDAPSPEQVQNAEQRAAEIVERLKQGADFREQAIQHSDGQAALEGGDLGWRSAAQWPALFSDAAINLKVGEVAGPIRAGNGFNLIKLIDRRGDEQKIVRQFEVRHILIRPSAIRNNQQAQTLAQQLRSRIANGESLETLAREFSDDPVSARNGGSLEWVSPGEMVPEFDEIMQRTPIGQLSPVFQTEFGWHFLRVDNQRDADMSDEYRRLRARQALHQRRFSEELEVWLRELREESYVDIRLGTDPA